MMIRVVMKMLVVYLHLKIGKDGDEQKVGGEDDDARYGEGGGGCHISP